MSIFRQTALRYASLIMLFGLAASCGNQLATAQTIDLLHPDIVPFVSPTAPANMQTLQAWELRGSDITFNTMFSNVGEGLFEIRRGDVIDSQRHELLQRIYIDEDFGPEYIDIPIGSAPIPGTPATPRPNDLNVIWFEDFSRFSLHEAPVVDGIYTLGAEVAGTTKTSWRLSSNRGPLPGFNTPNFGSPDQRDQQRISVGWADLYSAGSLGQGFDISDVPVGPLYWLQQTVDPANRIAETDETNNSFQVLIDLNRPGEAFMFAGEFLQPGDPIPPQMGDINVDGSIDLDDWLAFKANATVPLDGLSATDAYALGDFDLDGQHTVADAVLFRQYFDAANGSGAFLAMSRVPEPNGLLIVCILAGCGLGIFARWGRTGKRCAVVAILLPVLICGPGGVDLLFAKTLFFEDFENLQLGPNVNEGLFEPNAWTDTPPTGWTVDDSGVPYLLDPTRGVEEWKGWSFANKDWWASTAGNQSRANFSFGNGVVAVADADEWDDLGGPINGSPFQGYYNAMMRTPHISLTDATDSVQLSFASSWRDEADDDGPNRVNNQTAIVRAYYDGASSPVEVLRWESRPSSPHFKDDAVNERIIVDLPVQEDSESVQLEFGLLNAGNDWWWAIDDVMLEVPITLVVNTLTGNMEITGAENLVGYEITSDSGSLAPAAWLAGNLDAQNFGGEDALSADFNGDGRSDISDYTIWRDSYAAGNGGDANGDEQTSDSDYVIWKSQFGQETPLGDSWESVIATEEQLYEFFLNGESTFDRESVGFGFDVGQGSHDLDFTVVSSAGEIVPGKVVYVSVPNRRLADRQTAPVPEPASILLILAASITLSQRTRLR